LSNAPPNGSTISVIPWDGSRPVTSIDPSIRPEVTSALAAKAARIAVISDDSASCGAVVVVSAAIDVVERSDVVDSDASDALAGSSVVATVVAADSGSLSVAVASSDEVPAHAETTSKRTVKVMLIRLVTGLPFFLSGRDEAYQRHRHAPALT
jgi:hypothetical protein